MNVTTLLIILIILEIAAYYVKLNLPAILIQLLHIATVVVFLIWLLGFLGLV